MIECEQCGAPITTEPTDGYFQCSYCKSKTRAQAAAAPPAQPARAATPTPRVVPQKRASSGGRVACLGVVAVAIIGAAGYFVFFGSGPGGGTGAGGILGPRVVSFTGHVCFQRVNDDQAVDILGEAYAGDDGNRIFAIDGLTGAALWATEARMESDWHAYCGDAHTMVLATPDFRLLGVEVRTGATKWDQRFSDVVEMVHVSPTRPCAVARLSGDQSVPFDLNTGATVPACADAPATPARRYDAQQLRKALWPNAQGAGLTVNVGTRQEGTPTLIAAATDPQGATRWTTPLPAIGLGLTDARGFAGFDGERFLVVGRGLGNDRLHFFSLEAATGRVLHTFEETEDHRDASNVDDIRIENGLLYIASFATTIAYNPRTFEEVWSIGW